MIKLLDLERSRLELALEQFGKGGLFSFNEVAFRLVSDQLLEIQVESNWTLDNLDDGKVRNEFKRAKSALEYFSEKVPNFAALTNNFKQRFVLIDDFDHGTVEICSMENGVLVWNTL